MLSSHRQVWLTPSLYIIELATALPRVYAVPCLQVTLLLQKLAFISILVQTVFTPSTAAMHARDWAKLIHAQMQDVQRWSSHVQACMSDLARQTTADKRLVLDDLYDEFLEILWNADPKVVPMFTCGHSETTDFVE